MRMNQHPRLSVLIKRHRLHAIRRFAFRAARIAQHTNAKMRSLRHRQIRPLRAVFLKIGMIRIMAFQRLRIIHHRLMRLAQPRILYIIAIKRISHGNQNRHNDHRRQQFNQSKAFCLHLTASLRNRPHRARHSGQTLWRKFGKGPHRSPCSGQKREQKNHKTKSTG